MPLSRPPVLLTLSVLFLGACAPAQPTPIQTIQPTPIPATPTPLIPTATPEPTAAPQCTDTAGTIQQQQLALPGDERPLVYWLYLPPCFDAKGSAPYPTLYLLHGLAQSESEWIDLGIAEPADGLIAQKAIPPFVAVMPGERTGFDMLSLVVDILLPEIEGSLPTGGSPQLRAIGGISRGGGWALRIGMQRPDLFGAIGLHSPAVISPDLYALPTWAAKVPQESIPRLWVDIGRDDTLFRPALDLRQQLDAIRWPYTWIVGHGEHTSTYWSSQLENYLRWYAEGWPLSPSSSG